MARRESYRGHLIEVDDEGESTTLRIDGAAVRWTRLDQGYVADLRAPYVPQASLVELGRHVVDVTQGESNVTGAC